MKFSAAALVSASFASVVAGQGCASQKPVGDNPSGNSIHAPLSQIVPAGTPFTVVWTNTTTGFVNIELLRGPSTNVVPIQCLADHIPNTGKYVWTPSPSLQADVTHYGLRIVVSGTGQFQYSNQFGISNDVVHPPSSSLSPTTQQQQQQQYPATTVNQASDGQLQVPTSPPSKPATTTAPSTTSSVPIIANTNSTITTSSAIASTPVANSSVIIGTTHVSIPVVPSGGSGGSSGRPYTQTALQPTNNMTVPASLQTSKKTPLPTKVTASASASVVVSSSSGTGSPIASATGSGAPSSGAGKVVAGGLVAGLGAVAAFVVL